MACLPGFRTPLWGEVRLYYSGRFIDSGFAPQIGLFVCLHAQTRRSAEQRQGTLKVSLSDLYEPASFQADAQFTLYLTVPPRLG